MSKRYAAVVFAAVLNSVAPSYGTEFDGTVGPGALKLGAEMTVMGQAVIVVAKQVPFASGLYPVGAVLTNAGSVAPALAESQRTGKQFASTITEQTAEVNKAFLATQAGTKAAEWMGANPLIATSVGKHLGKAVEGKSTPNAAVRSFEQDETGSIGGIQNATANNSGLFGSSGITQYNLLGTEKGSEGSRPKGRDSVTSQPRSRDRSPNPGDEMIGRVPGSGDSFFDALGRGLIGESGPATRGESRCGRGMHGADISTPNPRSCY